MNASSPKSGGAVLLLVPAILGVVLHFHGLTQPFMRDDRAILVDNARLVSPTGVSEILTTHYWEGAKPAGGLYRPVPLLSFLLDARLFGIEAPPLRAVNLLLHALVAVLVVVLGRAFGFSRGASLLGGILFAVHPVHIEVLQEVKGREEILAALFGLSGLAVLLLRPSLWGWLAGLLLGLALFSKESAVAFVLLAFLLPRLSPQKAGSRTVVVSAALALLLFVGVRTLVLGSPLGLDRALIPRIDNPLAHVGALPRILTALELQMQAVWLLLFPVRLTPDRSLGAFTVVDSVTPIALAGGLLLLLGGALVMRRWISGRGPRPLGLVIGLAVLSWIPVSNLFVPTGTTLADRLLYVPSVAVCLLVAGFLVKVPRARLLFVPVVLSLALLSVLRVTVWSSEEGLYRDALRVVPGSARVLASVAWYDLEGGRFEEAEASASKALTVYPGYGKAHAIRAHALRGLGDWEQAGKEYRVVLTCENVSASDLHNLAAWLFSSEATLTRLLEAESLLFQALEEDSSFAPARELIDRVRERIASLRNANDLAPAGRRDR